MIHHHRRLQRVSRVKKYSVFSDIVKTQGENESVAEKIISDGTKNSESINDTEQNMFQLKIP